MNLWHFRLLRPPVAALFLPVLVTGALSGADLKAGFGRRSITPPLPIPLAGFANRAKPAESVATDLWSKALAFEDAAGEKTIIITVELATMPKAMFGHGGRQGDRPSRHSPLASAHQHLPHAFGTGGELVGTGQPRNEVAHRGVSQLCD